MSEFLAAPDPDRFPALGEAHVRLIGPDVSFGRIYWSAGAHPGTWNGFRRFGPTTSRFDHHPLPRGIHTKHGVMYLAPALHDALGRQMSSLRTAMVECFRDTGVVDATSDDPYFVLFRPTRRLRLLYLADSDWITRAGGNAAISSGPRGRSREWARAIYAHYQGKQAVDGVLYTTSNLPSSRSVALWETAADALPDRPAFHEPLRHVGLRRGLEAFGSEVGLGLIL